MALRGWDFHKIDPQTSFPAWIALKVLWCSLCSNFVPLVPITQKNRNCKNRYISVLWLLSCSCFNTFRVCELRLCPDICKQKVYKQSCKKTGGFRRLVSICKCLYSITFCALKTHIVGWHIRNYHLQKQDKKHWEQK